MMEQPLLNAVPSRVDVRRIGRELGLFIVVLALALIASDRHFRSDRARDYYQFWAVGRGARLPSIDNVYTLEARARIGQSLLEQAEASHSDHWRRVARQRALLEPAGTPFLYTVFQLLSHGDYERDYERYRVLSVLGYAAAIVAIARLLGFGTIGAIILPVLFTVFFYPFQLDVLVGNVNQIQLAVLAGAIALTWTQRLSLIGLAGGLLGTAVFFKPNLVLIPFLWCAMWMIDRKYARSLVFVGGAAVGALIALILPGTVLGPACSWSKWWIASDSMLLQPLYMDDSFIGMIVGVSPILLHRVVGLLTVAAGIGFLVLTRRPTEPPAYSEPAGSRKNDGIETIAAAYTGFLLYVLASPLTHGRGQVLRKGR